jgi:predicted phage terminase large subunit-like protein
LFIEDKASGQQLIQDFKRIGLPVRPIEVTKDKLTRVEEVLDYIAAGLVHLPENRAYGNNNILLSECEAFSRDMSHKHDDIVDTLVHLINNTIAKREVSILEVL